MKRHLIYLLAFSFLVCITLSCSKPQTIQLWNGVDFSGWKLFVPSDTIDVNEVWSIKDAAIFCKGIPSSYLRTEAEYSNFILTLDWRWVEKESNSGVLLHAQEPDQVWPNSIECQLLSKNAGDLIIIGPGSLTVDGKKIENTGRYIIIPKKQNSNEKPVGEWNSCKIIAKNDEITCYINGLLQNHATQASLTKGKICLQSEGAPIEFRNIQLELID
jgi:hypothetical protein